MKVKLCLVVACILPMILAGCGDLIFGDGSEGAPCLDLSFDSPSNGKGRPDFNFEFDFLSCNEEEGLACDTTANAFEAICSVDLTQAIEDLIAELITHDVPPNIAEKIANIATRIAELWGPVCELLSGLPGVGICMAPEA